MLSIFIFLSINIVCAQSNFSKNCLKFSVGYGGSSSTKIPIEANGFSFGFGYQRNIYKEKLRFNSNFTFGNYNPGIIYDAPQFHFNSFSLHTNFYLDLLKVKAFSLFAGTGPFITYNHGFIEPMFSKGVKVNNFYPGLFIGSGLRFNPKNKRIAIELLPLDLNFGTKGFFEYSPKISLDFKLK